MATRQRSRAPRKSQSSQTTSGESVAETTASQPSAPPTVNTSFQSNTLDASGAESENTDIPKATFVGEQLVYQDRGARIAEAAYFRAQQRGFTPGYELEDWLIAERDVDALMADGSAQNTRR